MGQQTGQEMLVIDVATVAERLGRIDGRFDGIDQRFEGVNQRIGSLERKVCNGDGSVLSEIREIRKEIKDLSRLLGKYSLAQEGLKVKVAVIAAGCALAVSATITVLVRVLF